MGYEAERSSAVAQVDASPTTARRIKVRPLRPLVLIVDDDADARAIYAEILEREGFRTAEADDGATGIETAIAARPDIVLMDCSMPGVSGAEAAHWLKRDTRTSAIPIVMLTGFAFSRPSSESSPDCDAYLVKPTTGEDVAATLRSVLAGMQAPALG